MNDKHCHGEISRRREAQLKYAVKIQHIADAIVAAGYISLDSQAKALGLKRSTAWTIIKTKHKLDRLSGKTTDRMLANLELPPPVRAVVQQYLAERSVAAGRKRRRRQRRPLTPFARANVVGASREMTMGKITIVPAADRYSAPVPFAHRIWNRTWPQAMVGLGLGLTIIWIFFLGYV